jgi:hypothetical protein
MSTEIKAYDRRGKVAFHSVEPREMTDAEIEAELDAWAVDRSTHRIEINR